MILEEPIFYLKGNLSAYFCPQIRILSFLLLRVSQPLPSPRTLDDYPNSGAPGGVEVRL